MVVDFLFHSPFKQCWKNCLIDFHNFFFLTYWHNRNLQTLLRLVEPTWASSIVYIVFTTSIATHIVLFLNGPRSRWRPKESFQSGESEPPNGKNGSESTPFLKKSFDSQQSARMCNLKGDHVQELSHRRWIKCLVWWKFTWCLCWETELIQHITQPTMLEVQERKCQWRHWEPPDFPIWDVSTLITGKLHECTFEFVPWGVKTKNIFSGSEWKSVYWIAAAANIWPSNLYHPNYTASVDNAFCRKGVNVKMNQYTVPVKMFDLENGAFSDDARLAGSQTGLDCLLRLVFCVLSQHMLKIISDPSSRCAILTSLKWWMSFAFGGDGRWFFWLVQRPPEFTFHQLVCCMYCSRMQTIFLWISFFFHCG